MPLTRGPTTSFFMCARGLHFGFKGTVWKFERSRMAGGCRSSGHPVIRVRLGYRLHDGMLSPAFFDRPSPIVARDLVGKVLRRRYRRRWLAASIVEAEAYEKNEKGSHASLGRTPSREALFMPPGTIYMYYARGKDSLNVSCRGEGNAVLIKGALVYTDDRSPSEHIELMHALNPLGSRRRPDHRLCAGQTLLCQALALRVPDWDKKSFDPERFFIEDVGYRPERLVCARRLGIPSGRDEHLMYRYVDFDRVHAATVNPITYRGAKEGTDYRLIPWSR